MDARVLAIVVGLIAGTHSFAQEVGSIDLTKITAQKQLRRPPSTQNESGPRGGVEQVRACFHSSRKVGTLRADVVALDRTHYQINDEPILEVMLDNTGAGPITIPFSPQLVDVQAKDPAQRFAYLELNIALWIASDTWSANTGGIVTLYGSEEHAGTMLTLNPGESVRVIGRGKLLWPDGIEDRLLRSHPADRVFAQAELYRAQTLVTSRQSATTKQALCLAQSEGQSAAIEIIFP
jgi:hypothetical protein